MGVTRAGLQLVVERVFGRRGLLVHREADVMADDSLMSGEIPLWRRRAPLDQSMLDLVSANREGIIRYAAGRVDVAWLIAELAAWAFREHGSSRS